MIALACAGASTATASAKGNDPDPAAARAPTQAEEAGLRQRLRVLEQDALAHDGVKAIANERDALLALGQNPDDPVALAAYRAEAASATDPAAVTAVGDFILDAGWGSGGLAPDRYAGSNSGTYRGIKAATLSNGDLVVVGEVQFSSGGTKQLGITRRGANGARVVWTGVAPQYSAFGGQYILWPNADTSLPPIYGVKDVKVYGNRIYALVTGHLSSPNTYAPAVICFNADGSGCGWWFAYADAGSSVNDAVAMDVLGSRLVVLGRHSLGETGGFWTAKWTVGSDGGLDDLVFADFPTPGGYARSEPVDIAFRRVGAIALTNPGYYVLFTKKFSADTASTDYDPCLFAVTSANAPDATFPGGSAGVRCKPFDQDSARTDRAVALTTNGWQTFVPVATHEGVQVLASVTRGSSPGIGMWELFDRVDHPNFGAIGGAAGAHALGGGRVLFGGCSSSAVGEGCPLFPGQGYTSHVPMDLANVGGDVGVVGYRHGPGILIGGGYTDSALFARVHGDSGELEQFTTFSSGYSEGRYNAIGVRDSSHVVGVGEAIDSTITTATARTQVQTGLTSDDTIFRNGLD
jgi:hypothetical protein